MTETEISKFVAALEAENSMLVSDRERQFDGSPAWRQLADRMEEEVLRLSQGTNLTAADEDESPR